MSAHTRPHVGVAMIVRGSQRKVLIHQRWGEHAGSGQWGFPGGHMEMWETFEKTAVRETLEECGEDLSFCNVKYFATENTMFMDEGKHYVVIFMVCDWLGGEPINTEPEKGDDWQWVEWDKLHTLPGKLMIGIRKLLEKDRDPFRG